VRFHSSARPGGEALGDPPDMLYRLELDGVRTCVETIHAVHPETLVMIEPGRDSVCNTTARLAALLDDLGAPNVGINWDFVNAWRAGEHPWPEPWDHLRGRLYGVHWKGARAEPHEPRRYACHFVPGDDDIQHRSMWATWAAVGFDGPVTADPEYHFFAPRDHFDPEPERPEWVLCCTYLDKMIDYRRRAWERLVC
jgi:sugar phosphate isomerase/epimerase